MTSEDGTCLTPPYIFMSCKTVPCGTTSVGTK